MEVRGLRSGLHHRGKCNLCEKEVDQFVASCRLLLKNIGSCISFPQKRKSSEMESSENWHSKGVLFLFYGMGFYGTGLGIMIYGTFMGKTITGPHYLWPFSTVGMRLLLAISRRTAEMIGRTQKMKKMHVHHEKFWECGTSTRQVRSSSNLYRLLWSHSSIGCVFGWIFKKIVWGVIMEERWAWFPQFMVNYRVMAPHGFDSLPLSFFVTAFYNLVKRWKYAGGCCPDKLEE